MFILIIAVFVILGIVVTNELVSIIKERHNTDVVLTPVRVQVVSDISHLWDS